jgi:hypothetical protein
VYASLVKIAPDGFRRGARLASGAFYFAVRLMTFCEIINGGGTFQVGLTLTGWQ